MVDATSVNINGLPSDSSVNSGSTTYYTPEQQAARTKMFANIEQQKAAIAATNTKVSAETKAAQDYAKAHPEEVLKNYQVSPNTYRAKNEVDNSGALANGTDKPTIVTTTNPDKSIIKNDGNDKQHVDLSKINYLPNDLDNYQSPAYYFRLVACAEPFPQNYDTYKTAKNVVIAETGSTLYNITEVHITNKVGQDFRRLNSFGTQIQIHITEPFGSSLLEAFKNSCQVLQVANYSKSCYYLELHFNGYDSNGVPQTNIGFGNIDDSPRSKYKFLLYRITLNTVDVKLSESGSNYVIEAIPLNEKSFETICYRIPMPTIQSAIGKLGGPDGVFAEFTNALNDSILRQYVGRQKFKYAIDCQFPKISESIFQAASDKNQFKDDKLQTGKGITITEFINAAIVNSSFSNEYIGQLNGDGLKTPDEQKTALTMIWQIIPEYKYGEYDFTLGDYLCTVTYKIMPYKSVNTITSDADLQYKIKNKETTLDQIVQYGLLRKKYDYIYTGLNNNILNYDIKFNLNFVSLVQTFGTQSLVTRTTQIQTGQVVKDDKIDVTTTANYQLTAIDNTLQFLQAKVNTTALNDPSLQNAIAKAQELSVKYKDSQIALTGENAWALTELQNANKTLVEAANTATKSQLSVVAGGRYTKYAEDIKNLKQNTSESIPISILYNPQELTAQIAPGNSGGADIGKSALSSVLDQTFGAKTKEMQFIELEIKGDPYWLGNTDMDVIVSQADPTSVNHCVYYNGDHCIVVVFRLPSGLDENNNPLFDDKATNLFNGIYGITECVNTFSGGKFTQHLKGNRSPALIDAKVI